MKDKDRSQI